MRVPVEWLRSVVELPAEATTEEIADRLTMYDLKLEEIVGGGITGPLTVGRVLAVQPEKQKNGKTINWCRVDVGPERNEPSVPDAPGDDVPSRGIVCGAHNFGVGDLVVVSLPGTHLPELGFEIGSRKTYGHVSDGMICSTRELGLPDDETSAAGILVLEPGSATPGDDAVTVLGLGDQTLDLEVNPDRAYALSLRGVGRDAALAFDVPFADPADRPVPSADTPAYPVRVEDPEGCPVFTALVVSGVDPTAPTPAWMARRITDAGMRSISLTVDVSNYVMLELGQPNHCYDRDRLQGDVVVRRAREGERLTTLDDVDRALTPDDLVIADDSGPVGLAGVMGGASTEISDTSTSVVVEAAYWDPVTIFRAVKRHRLPSEAAKRYERGVDPELALVGAARVAELLVELGGGTLEPGATVVGEAPARAAVRVPVDLPARISGVPIAPEEAQRTFERNGCTVERDGDVFVVTPPSWRFDLNDPYDFVEEALRTAGYDQVPSVLPTPTGGRGLTRHQELRRRVGHVLAGAGLVEVTTLPFAGPADLDRLGIDADDVRRRQVLLANPLSTEEPGLTTTLLVGLLRAASLNVGRGHESVQVSEVGRVFLAREGAPEAPIYGTDRRHRPVPPGSVRRAGAGRHGRRARGRAAPDRAEGARPPAALGGRRDRPRRAARGLARDRPPARLLDLPGREGGPRVPRRHVRHRRVAARGTGVGPRRGRVGAPLRRLHGRARAGWPEVARLRRPPPRPRPHPQGHRDRRGARRPRRRRRGAGGRAALSRGGWSLLVRCRRGSGLAGALPAGVSSCWCAASAGAVSGPRKGLDRRRAWGWLGVSGSGLGSWVTQDSSFLRSGAKILRLRVLSVDLQPQERFCG